MAKRTRVDPGQSLELYRAMKIRKPDVPCGWCSTPAKATATQGCRALRYNLRVRWFDTYLKTGDRVPASARASGCPPETGTSSD